MSLSSSKKNFKWKVQNGTSHQSVCHGKMAARGATFFCKGANLCQHTPMSWSPAHLQLFGTSSSFQSAAILWVRHHQTNKQTSPASKQDQWSQLECNLSNPVICRSKGVRLSASSLLLLLLCTSTSFGCTCKKQGGRIWLRGCYRQHNQHIVLGP